MGDLYKFILVIRLEKAWNDVNRKNDIALYIYLLRLVFYPEQTLTFDNKAFYYR